MPKMEPKLMFLILAEFVLFNLSFKLQFLAKIKLLNASILIKLNLNLQIKAVTLQIRLWATMTTRLLVAVII